MKPPPPPRAWFEKFSNTMCSLGFAASRYDFGLFTKSTDKGTIHLLLYVDDMIITSSDIQGINDLKEYVHQRFEMKNLELLR